jgi:hypothetical protein
MKGNQVIYKGDWSFPVKKEFILNPNISVGAKCVYIALRSYCAPNQNTAFPSTVTLAKALSISRTTLLKHAKELEQAGYLKRKQADRKTGKFTHTLWTLYGGQVWEKAPCPSS